MNNLEEVLSELKDIHEPTSVTWWPLAPGWYLLIVIVIVIILSLYFFRKYRRNSFKRKAKQEFQRIERDFAIKHDHSDLVKNISTFLRRVMLARNVKEMAALTGDIWLATLDEQSKEKVFVDGPGRILAEGPYRRDVTINSEELIGAVKRWLRALK